MIVKCNNKGTTADATVALANFNTERGILGGKVTQAGPKARIGDVYVYINGTPIGANENASTTGVTGQSRFINEGTFTIKK